MAPAASKLHNVRRLRPPRNPPGVISSFGFGRAVGFLCGALTGEKVKSYATHTFHTAAPIAFGKTAAP